MKYGILSRHDAIENEKCPKCLMVFQHFIEVGEGVLGCLKCGSVFVGKVYRETFTPARIVEILKAQKKAAIQPAEERSEFIAPCGFEAKSKAGKVAHERSCGKCGEV